MAKFPFADFARVISENEKKTKRQNIVDGIASLGPNYSFGDDTAMDSLDTVEAVMTLEEALQRLSGFESVELSDDMLEKAKNVGDLYRAVCKQVSIEPDFDSPATSESGDEAAA